MKNTAEAFPAIVWTCDACGQENFERTRVASADQQEEYANDVREEYDLAEVDPWPEGEVPPHELMVIPSTVICRNCDRTNDVDVPDHICRTDKGEITWMAGTDLIVGLTEEDDLFLVMMVAEDCWRAEIGADVKTLIGTDFDTHEDAMIACEEWLEMHS